MVPLLEEPRAVVFFVARPASASRLEVPRADLREPVVAPFEAVRDDVDRDATPDREDLFDREPVVERF